MVTQGEKELKLISRIWAAQHDLSVRYTSFTREILRNFNIVAGKVYSDKYLEKLKKEERPVFQFNLARPIINSIVGSFKQNIPGVNILPRQPSDEEIAQLFELLNDYICYQQNDLKYEIAVAYLHALIGRVGWIKQEFIYDDKHPNGYVRIQHVDPFTVYADISTQSRNLTNCNYICESMWLSVEDVLSTYANDNSTLSEQILTNARELYGPSMDEKQRMQTWSERVRNLKSFAKSELRGFNSDVSRNILDNQFTLFNDGLLHVINFYEKRQTHQMLLVTDSSTVDITEFVKVSDDINERDWFDKEKLQRILEKSPQSTTKEKIVSKYWQSTVCPILNLVLYDNEQDIQSNFKLTPIFCYDWSPDFFETRSIVDDMKDQIQSFNELNNAVHTILNSYAKGGYIAEEQAIKGYESDWIGNTKIGGIRRVRPGQLGHIQPMMPPPLPEGLSRYALNQFEFIKSITASTDPSRGFISSAGDSGKLFEAQVRQSNLMQEWHNENAQSSLKKIAENNIAFIKKYWTSPQVIRLDSTIFENAAKSFNLQKSQRGDYFWLELNNEDILKTIARDSVFDIQISTVPFGEIAKKNEFSMLVQANMLLGKINPALIDVKGLVENLPLNVGKKSLVDHVNEVINSTGQDQNQNQSGIEQLQNILQSLAPQNGVIPQNGEIS
jgi:hypothetical protein